MPTNPLSTEIISLIHHVELNESGWWRKAIGQVLKGVLWQASSAQTLAEIKHNLNLQLGINVGEDVLEKQVDILISQGAITRLPGPNYKLTEQVRTELTLARTVVLAEQDDCKNGFIASCIECCPALDSEQVWQTFTRSLMSAVSAAGANLFHLLADGKLERESDWLSGFLSRYDFQHLSGLQSVLSKFFAPDNNACRRQVLRLLSAHFFAEASQLRPETLALIESARKKRVIKVVLDTNFIFSILKLHDNPADDAAHSLLDIVANSTQQLQVKLYVLPGTLIEATATLAGQMRMIKHIRATNAMSRAALSQPLSGIARKFFDAAQRSPGLTAEAFFQPYIEDLRTILRGIGIHVLEAHPSIYNQRQDVIDDIITEQERESKEVPESKRKSYETLLHDTVLWHAVRDKRPEDTESPFEVEYWAVSIDWRLMAFDRKKRSAGASKLPVVLHPSNLVQLIQFWVPRSAALEESLIDSLRLSLYFQQFDPEDERATVKVLEAISRYENVADLPESTLKVVLANKVLRSKLHSADASNDEIFELVRDELISEHRETLAALTKTQGTLAQTQDSLEQVTARHDEAGRTLLSTASQLKQAEERVANAEQVAAAAEAARVLERQSIQEELLKRDAIEATHLKQKFALCFFILPLLLGVLANTWAQQRINSIIRLDKYQDFATFAALTCLFILPFAVACCFSVSYVARQSKLASWWPAKAVSTIGKKALVVPAVGVGAIFQGGVWDGVKAILGIS